MFADQTEERVTDRQTKYPNISGKITWAFISGEIIKVQWCEKISLKVKKRKCTEISGEKGVKNWVYGVAQKIWYQLTNKTWLQRAMTICTEYNM